MTQTPMLISPEYAALNAELHERVPAYGTGGHKWADYVRKLCAQVEAGSILDYGCGKQSLRDALPGLIVHGYDPAIEGCDTRVECDIVVCTDVLEHVEIECMREVVSDVIAHARKAVVLSIACRESGKILADGRQAHITVRSPDWWIGYLSPFGAFERLESPDDEFNAVLLK